MTDLYELTMAYGYWKSETYQKEAVFHLAFRDAPFQSGYAITAGLSDVISFLSDLKFHEDDLRYLATLKGNDGTPLFDSRFLGYLRDFRFTCDIDAIPEGTVAFPNEPLIRVTGPIIEAQIVETALLNLVNFQTLIATKAARICHAAQGEPVLEFGLRRAQGIDGGLSASRAAYIGGCHGTSNLRAGQIFGIPVGGTHAHSWVMSFADELEAFFAYAEALPNNCVFLVDTYDSLQGVRHAVEVGKRLRERHHSLAGIRLDSGDLAYLSIEARKILDADGFTDTAIVASNNLDEHIITSLKLQGAKINIWGVGTKLITGYDDPALNGVYKMSAMREPGKKWEHKIKLSEQSTKVTTPGVLQVRRFKQYKQFLGDMVFDEETSPRDARSLVDPADITRRKGISAEAETEDLLVPVFRGGRLIYTQPTLASIRQRAQEQLALLHPSIKRLLNPHEYPVGLEPSLAELRTKLILERRKM